MVSLWYASPDMWRCNIDTPYLKHQHTDTAVVDGELWSLDKQSLSVHDVSHPESAESKRYAFEGSLADMRVFVSQGLTLLVGTEKLSNTIELDVTESGWVARVIYESGARGEARGGWIASGESQLPEVHKVACFPKGSATPLVEREMSGHTLDPVLGRRVPLEVRDTRSPAWSRWNLAEAQMKGSIREIASKPTRDGADPIRGKLNVAQFFETLDKGAVMSVRKDDAWHEIPLARKADVQGFWTMTTAGWIGGTAVVVVLITVKLKRSSLK